MISHVFVWFQDTSATAHHQRNPWVSLRYKVDIQVRYVIWSNINVTNVSWFPQNIDEEDGSLVPNLFLLHFSKFSPNLSELFQTYDFYSLFPLGLLLLFIWLHFWEIFWWVSRPTQLLFFIWSCSFTSLFLSLYLFLR